MAPESSDTGPVESTADVGLEGGSPHEPSRPDTSPEDVLNFDGRLHVLERESLEYRVHLLRFEDALISQIWTVGVLELVFAMFLAVTVWSQYRTKVVVRRGSE